ncbi:hypothetical protein SBC1_08820 [Caballeronia sp. SBC1]|uniref:hypothetical protein n=1 Tax=Caballeronia sp. SBC1 TaxID=2705548 RepID=UPI00140D54D1|nr:hypothetical protein [Caballeronia sp. SBC1]QIN60903.1 hypothetical protein SBC1_08820 [Caballeronia sp. SBC1]
MKARTMKRFTCDALIRLAVQKRKQADVKPEALTTDAVLTEDRVDLNEIHRRFWAKLAGKE